MEKRSQNKLVNELRNDLERYEKIILFWGPKTEELSGKLLHLNVEKISGLTEIFSNSYMINKHKQKVLVLCAESQVEIQKKGKESFVKFKMISKKEAQFIYSLYHMYEFSNRFFIVSNESICGNLFNFIETGLLCVEEVIEALLY